MEACGKAFPESKNAIDAAFQRWLVLGLAIPRLDEAMAHDSALQVGLRESVTPYFERIPADQKAIECEGRLEMILNPKPTIGGDSAKCLLTLFTDTRNKHWPLRAAWTGKEYARHDKGLNAAYRKLMGSFERRAEEAVIGRRVTTGQVHRSQLRVLLNPDGGTMAQMQAAECGVMARIERGAELEDLAK